MKTNFTSLKSLALIISLCSILVVSPKVSQADTTISFNDNTSFVKKVHSALYKIIKIKHTIYMEDAEVHCPEHAFLHDPLHYELEYDEEILDEVVIFLELESAPIQNALLDDPFYSELEDDTEEEFANPLLEDPLYFEFEVDGE